VQFRFRRVCCVCKPQGLFGPFDRDSHFSGSRNRLSGNTDSTPADYGWTIGTSALQSMTDATVADFSAGTPMQTRTLLNRADHASATTGIEFFSTSLPPDGSARLSQVELSQLQIVRRQSTWRLLETAVFMDQGGHSRVLSDLHRRSTARRFWHRFRCRQSVGNVQHVRGRWSICPF
jgi:hypothetical protein